MPAAARFAAPKGQRAGCLLTLHLLNLGGIVVEHKEVHALQQSRGEKQTGGAVGVGQQSAGGGAKPIMPKRGPAIVN